METKGNRRLRLIIAIMASVFLVCATLGIFAACEKKNDELDTGVKPEVMCYLSYELIKDEFSIDEEVRIELVCGTHITKEYADRDNNFYSDTEARTVNLFALNYTDNDKESWMDNPSKILILEIKDFYRENYPYPSETVKAKTTEVSIPKTLFVEDKGKIFLIMNVCDTNFSTVIFYEIKDEKICLSKEREKTGKGDVIITYREDVKK